MALDADVLEGRDLKKRYRHRWVVNGVTIQVRRGEVVGLLGPNGAGKTTTFYMLIGFVTPDDGRVLLGDRDITRLPMYRRARLGISYLPQEPSVFRKLTVEENILLVLEMQGLSPRQQREIAEHLMDELNLTRVRKHLGQELSGGERRRVEIARALATNPKFLLLDEPFTGVDPIAVDDLQRIVTQLRQRGIGILITDHNVRETLKITDRSYIISEGVIRTHGTPQVIVNDPVARRYYLGESFEL
ncbi:Lipopolysaccharide export system ATP-binding protein LptB [bacterium HR17]|jgi:lipopolysaccharide export system ATP-binding protein|uniref:Lipopolysaccharide export system ATP-binding protein LptB n=1 Tax=Candidatus Fervidibacter japonicus TaxID=2035412 RepID=A0A2H5XFV3_9BACT|nr:Lipopolysaccharide export system ATP-binding protein LptB [bacterium HR17]